MISPPTGVLRTTSLEGMTVPMAVIRITCDWGRTGITSTRGAILSAGRRLTFGLLSIRNLAKKMPEVVAELEMKWLAYARINEVVHPDQPVAYGKPVKPGKY